MKIAVISTPIFRLPISGYGGLEILAWQQAAGLAAKGHEVFLFCPDGSTCPGVTIVPFGAERTVSEKDAYSRYWQQLAGMDAIIDNTWEKWCYLGAQEGWLKAPILGVMHAPVNTMYSTLPPVEKPCIVCISEDQRQHFEALFGREARTCRNGIDLDFYKPLDVPRTDRFLFLARFSSVKGPDIGIEACKAADVGLDLVGDTSITNEPELFAKCNAMADGKQIRIIGGVSRGETVWWYSQAHCMIHPNQRFREPLGLSVLESQASMTPCIAWRYGAVKETIIHGETGWLANTFDEYTTYIRSAAGGISDDMRKRCREWASEFSVQKMVDRYDELISEAVESGGW